MANKIVLKKSSVAAKVPVAGDLDFGELAINYTDGKLYFKKADNTIDAFTTAAAAAPVTSVGGNIGDITDAQLLASIKNVDGTGSGLDADTLDGNHASAFYLASNPNGYTSNTGTVTSVGATAPLVSSGGTAPSISIPAANSTTNGYMTSAYAAKLDGIAAGATANTGTVTSVSGTGTVAGLSLSGTVTTSGSLSLSGTLSASIDNITDEHRIFNNMGQNHSTQTDFNAISDFGVRYVQGGTNGPTGVSSNQFYGFTLGLGNNYALSSYASQFYWPRAAQNADTYIYVRDREGGTWGSWRKTKAGYADTAGSVAWTNVSGRPTTLSSFTNDSGYITSSSAVARTEFRNFGTIYINPNGSNANCTTAQFITHLTNLGFFNYSSATGKCAWNYAGNNDLTDTGFGTIDLAGCVIETWWDGSNKHVRITRPTTGAGGFQTLVYNDQGSGYSPGWRQYITSENIASQSVNYATSSGNASTVTSITSSQVTTALGYTPYNSTNPNGYVTSSGSVNYASSAGNSDTVDGYHASSFVKTSGTVNNNIDSDWGEGFVTFDPIPSGTPPISSPNIRVVNVGPDYNRRTQIAFNYATDQSWFRRKTDASWGSWREFIHSGNIASQSVNYATSSGNASTVTSITSSQVTTALGYTPYNSTNPNGYVTSSGSITGSAGSVSGLTLTSSANGINPDNVTQNQLGYNTSVSLFGQTDGGLYSSAYSSSWVHQIYGDFRTGQIAIRGKNSGTWQAWRTVLDSSNYTSYTMARDAWNGNLYFNNDGRIYCTIMYDSNNSGYYSDPSSTSNLSAVNVADSLVRLQKTHTEGGEIRLLNTASTAGGFIQGWDSGIRTVDHNWTTTTWSIDNSGNSIATASHRAPIFYDNNDTGYYIDPSSTSNSAQRMRGGTLYGPNPTWGAYLYVGTDGRVGTNATVAVTNGNLHLDAKDGYDIYLNHYNGRWTRSPGFYDNNDTAYYIDANSTSRLNYVVPNRIKLVNNVNNEPRWDFTAYVVEAQHWYGNNSTQTMYLGESNVVYMPDIRPYIMYDRDNTGYYCDPNSVSNFDTINAARFASNQGSQSPNNSHPGYGIRPFYSWNIGQAYNDNAGYSNGITIGSHPGDQAYGFQIVQNMWDDATYTRRYNGGWQGWRKLQWVNDWMGSSLIHEDGRHYATILYDSNNTGYYVDPNSTTYIYYLQSATTVRADSDRRLKDNIKPIENALEKVRQLQGCTYTRKDMVDKTKVYMGMIAQDVLPIVPEVVGGSEEGKYSLGYAEMVPLLNEAIKEQDLIILQQEERIAKLEALVNKLIG